MEKDLLNIDNIKLNNQEEILNQINNYRRQRTYNFRKLFVSNLDSKITGHELNQIFD